MLFPALLRRALVVCTAIARLYADAAYHSAENRKLCAAEGILPLIRERGEPHGSGLGTVRCVGEHANAWLLANKRLDRRNDRLTNIIDALLTTACIFVIANRLILAVSIARRVISWLSASARSSAKEIGSSVRGS